MYTQTKKNSRNSLFLMQTPIMDNQFKIKPFRKKRRTLTLEDKKNIIENREKYNQSFEELADLYGVDRSTVSKIVKAKFTID